MIAQIHPRERPDFEEMAPLTRLRLTDERRYGSTLLLFFEHAEETDDTDNADSTDSTDSTDDTDDTDEDISI